MDYILRPYEKNDEYQIVELFKEVFNQDMTAEQWQWKYRGQGIPDIQSVVAIDENANMAGHFGVISVRTWFGNTSTISYQAVDQMIHKKNRGKMNNRGLYSQLGTYCWENLRSFKYGFVNLNHMRLGKVIGFFADGIEVLDHSMTAQKKRLSSFYKLESFHWDDRRVDTLWNTVHEGLGWAVVRDREFLKWRYERNPFHKYEFFALKKRFFKEILGWIVTKDAGDTLYVMDILFKDGHLEHLLQFAALHAYESDKKKVMVWLNGRYDNRLRLSGFQSVRRGTYIPHILLSKSCESDEMKDKFYFTMGDTDFL